VDALAAELTRFGVPVLLNSRVQAAHPEGVVLSDGTRVPGLPVIAAPGVGGEPAGTRRVTLVTLVVDDDRLADAPRGSGVLVAQGSGVGARALTHVTAKWPWVGELAGGREVLRLSYDEEPAAGGARRDASALLGHDIPEPDATVTITWERAAPQVHSVDGMHRVGESVSGTGIAAVAAQADAVARRIMSDAEPPG
jgi:oxygen-dependent protoporphyrinogen oxidase